MTQENINTPVGNDRLEEMTGDRRKEKKLPGAGFWLFFCLLFAAASLAAIWLAGSLVKSGVENIKGGPDDNPARVDSLLPSEIHDNQDIVEQPLPNGNKPSDTDQRSSSLQAQPPDAGQIKKQPVTVGETDIYLDEDGVWRNINRGAASAAASPPTAPSNPMAAFGAGNISADGSGSISPAIMMLMLSGLLSSEGGSRIQPGDISEIFEQLSERQGTFGQSRDMRFTNGMNPCDSPPKAH